MGAEIEMSSDLRQSMSLADWHKRFRQQSQWTRDIRHHLFASAKLQASDRVLEVGAGTGAVIGQVASEHQCHLTGIDIDFPSLCFAQSAAEITSLAQADAHLLPFPDQAFSMTFCHYLLMWVKDPSRVLAEMRRVTQPGGFVIALAESDYAGRIDAPAPLERLGELQTEALQAQGADIYMGRTLEALFHKAGFSNIEVGILGSQWRAGIPQESDETEWAVLLSDLGESLSKEELAEYRAIDIQEREAGRRVLFIPTFYAIGKAQ